MNISILQENLNKGLFMVSHIAGKNVNLPILNNIMIEAKDGNIKLITTDLEIGIVSYTRGKIEKEGAYTVDSKVITDFVSLLPNKKVGLLKKENALQVNCENYKTTIRGQETEEFPLIPKIEKKEYFEIKTTDFKQALAQVIIAVSANESRVELSGVYFNFNKNKLIIAATDSYRLAEKEVVVNTNNKEEKKIIVPARTLQEVLRVVSGIKGVEKADSGEKIKMYITENQVLFSLSSTEIVSRLIEGQYPDYKQIIPKDFKTVAKVNKEEFLRAVKATSIFSKTGINDINLDLPINKNKLIISSASSQVGENIVELDASVTGSDNGIVMNYRYLLDGINNIDSENVAIEITDGNTPCVLKAEKEEGYFYIIMPIKQ